MDFFFLKNCWNCQIISFDIKCRSFGYHLAVEESPKTNCGSGAGWLKLSRFCGKAVSGNKMIDWRFPCRRESPRSRRSVSQCSCNSISRRSSAASPMLPPLNNTMEMYVEPVVEDVSIIFLIHFKKRGGAAIYIFFVFFVFGNCGSLNFFMDRVDLSGFYFLLKVKIICVASRSNHNFS